MRKLAFALTLAWFPRIAIPLTTTACSCPEAGSAVILEPATLERNPVLGVGGEACTPEDVECMHRDARDRCDVYWITPRGEGRCLVQARFSDGTHLSSTIDYDLDGEYPCRGNVRPRVDGVTRL